MCLLLPCSSEGQSGAGDATGSAPLFLEAAEGKWGSIHFLAEAELRGCPAGQTQLPKTCGL